MIEEKQSLTFSSTVLELMHFLQALNEKFILFLLMYLEISTSSLFFPPEFVLVNRFAGLIAGSDGIGTQAEMGGP